MTPIRFVTFNAIAVAGLLAAVMLVAGCAPKEPPSCAERSPACPALVVEAERIQAQLAAFQEKALEQRQAQERWMSDMDRELASVERMLGVQDTPPPERAARGGVHPRGRLVRPGR
jgi:hypothetical protein